MKAGWWDAPLVLQDLAVSNLHIDSLAFIVQSTSSSVQNPASRVQRPESSNSDMPLVGTCFQKQSNVWNKTFENKSVAKDHQVHNKLTEYKVFVLKYEDRDIIR